MSIVVFIRSLRPVLFLLLQIDMIGPRSFENINVPTPRPRANIPAKKANSMMFMPSREMVVFLLHNCQFMEFKLGKITIHVQGLCVTVFVVNSLLLRQKTHDNRIPSYSLSHFLFLFPPEIFLPISLSKTAKNSIPIP